MEYVFVSFKEDRIVLADGTILGQTNQTLPIITGHHSFILAGLQNYHPPKVDVVIQQTTSLSPFKVEFN
jgi:hypothetical protein